MHLGDFAKSLTARLYNWRDIWKKWRFDERCPNGRFLIRKRSLRMVPRNVCSWPILAVGGLNLAVARLSDIGGTKWSTKHYMNMQLFKQEKMMAYPDQQGWTCIFWPSRLARP
jgi:hypothetical protein